MTGNPFEPPRTLDLDGDGQVGTGSLVLSEEAIAEVVAAAPWVRWLARMTSASIAVGLVGAVADLVTAKRSETWIGTLFSVAFGTMVSTLFLVVLRRYAGASERMRLDARGTAGHVIDAQASLFKLMGVIAAVGIGLLALLLVIGLVGKIIGGVGGAD